MGNLASKQVQKYKVKLADFDYVKKSQSLKKSQSRRDSCTLPDVECQMKSLENRKKVMGTPAYRPFEVTKLSC